MATQFDAIEFSIRARQWPVIAHAILVAAGSAGGELGVRRFLDEANEEADMRKFLVLSLAAAAFGFFATSAPADAATRKAQVVTAGQAVQMDLSARRYHRRYVYRYYGPRYRYYYGRPYYYAYPYYYYGPRYYRYRYYYPYYYPYGYYYYYGRPGFYFGFGF